MNTITSFLLSTGLCCLAAWTGIAADTSPEYPANGANYRLYPDEAPPLVPKPQELTWRGKAIPLSAVRIDLPPATGTDDKSRQKLIEGELTSFLRKHNVTVTPEASFRITFVREKTWSDKLREHMRSPEIAEEAYHVQATEQGISIRATHVRGFFYGMKTLEQLIIRRNGKTTLALCSISDWPDFPIRGFTNDVGRNFMPVPMIKRVIDSMADMKLNVYHFHFTENEGWRLESKLFPQLNDPKNFTRRPGEFYSQDDFRDLVNYCRQRNITLVPEMDMPGHSRCFRKAMGIESMNDPRATETLGKLIEEMYNLVPKGHLPYIHIGTDEAREKETHVDDNTLKQYFQFVEKLGATPIRWQPGLSPKGYNGAVQQLWSGRQARGAWPTKGASYIDSLETYLNHIDPFEAAMTLYFRRPCPFQEANGLGMFLCSWPDLPIEDPLTQESVSPIYSGIAFVSEPLWNNPHQPVQGNPNSDEYMKYFSNLPVQGDPLLQGFSEYENRILAIRDRFFTKRYFPYVRQANIPWKLIGPFPNEGKTATVFPPEQIIKTGKAASSYSFQGKTYSWDPETYSGGTLIFKHYCDFPTLFNGGKMGAFPHKNSTWYALTYIYSPKTQSVPFWISGQTWASSDWRNGPVSVPGKWFHCDPQFWVNGQEIAPPKWQKPGNNGAVKDENYYIRKPVDIRLNKGWNTVLVKSPVNNSARRWMFTFVPIQWSDKTGIIKVREFPGLKFSVNPSAPTRS